MAPGVGAITPSEIESMIGYVWSMLEEPGTDRTGSPLNLRRWHDRVLGIAVGLPLLFALVATGRFIPMVWELNPRGTVIIAGLDLLLLGCLWVVVRLLRRGTRVDAEAITVRRQFGSERIELSDIDHFDIVVNYTAYYQDWQLRAWRRDGRFLVVLTQPVFHHETRVKKAEDTYDSPPDDAPKIIHKGFNRMWAEHYRATAP